MAYKAQETVYTPPTQADIEESIRKYGRDIYNDFDLDDPVFNDKHFEILDDLVEKCPVAHSKVGKGYYLVSQNKLVREVGQNWRTFSAAKGYMPNRPDGVPYLYPEESDPPLHTAWRQALNPFMGPATVKNYEAQIREDANTLIDRFIDKGECEFVSEFAAVLPGWAFFKNVLGVPVDDLDKLVDGVEQGTFAPDLEERAARADTLAREDQAAERNEEWRQIFLEIMEDAPWIPVFHELQVSMHSTRVTGPKGIFTDPMHIPVHYEYIRMAE